MTIANILIVEDEAIVAHDLSSKLTNMGYVIVGTANTGREAIELTAKLEPDVVLMDIRLPGEIDGIQAAGEIYENNKTPVIYVTAYADDDTLRRARETHPAGYVLKPFDPRNLYVAIEMALYQRPLK
jgi:CheY-like chemotaxis protein